MRRLLSFLSFAGLSLLIAPLLAPSTSVAQRSIPLTLTRDARARARVLLSLRRGDRVTSVVSARPGEAPTLSRRSAASLRGFPRASTPALICDDRDRDAPRCGDEVGLPGAGTYRLDIELTPAGEAARTYVYRLPIARDATASSLELDVASSPFPDTEWLGSLWLDVARPGEPDGMRIDADGYLHVRRRVLWRYGMVSVERLDGDARPEGHAWCPMGPPFGAPVWVRPGVPRDLRGSSSRSLRASPSTRLRADVHVPITLGSTADAPTERPRLRRTERRTVVR